MKQVRMIDSVDELLNEIAKKRKGEGSLISNKQAIVHELIVALHKKEIKK